MTLAGHMAQYAVPMRKASPKCVRLTILEDNSVVCLSSHSGPSIDVEYSINNDEWLPYTVGTALTCSIGDTVDFRAGENGNTGFMSTGSTEEYNAFHGSGKYKVSGNPVYLLQQDGNVLSVGQRALAHLFSNDLAVVDATEYELPALSCDQQAFAWEFYGATNLSAGLKDLPVEYVPKNLYQSLYDRANNLKTLPDTCEATYIGDGSFFYFYTAPNLNSHVLHFTNNVTYIGGDQCFNQCYCIKDFSNNTQVPTRSSTNDHLGNGGSIIVPDNLYEDWIVASNWSAIASKIVKHSDFYGS